MKMDNSKPDSNPYDIEVFTCHSVIIEWVLKDSHRDNYAYIDTVYDSLERYWSVVSGQFPGVKLIRAGDIYDRQKGFTLRGDDAQVVLAAGKDMAKLIFSHEFVEPIKAEQNDEKEHDPGRQAILGSQERLAPSGRNRRGQIR